MDTHSVKGPKAHVFDPDTAIEAGKYFRYMAEFVGFTEKDAQAIRESALIAEKHLPEIIGQFYTNLLQYPPTRKYFLKKDGTVDDDYLKLRMYHQANFWRRTAGGVYDDEYAAFVDYVGRAHTSRGADQRIYIAERYVIGMVGFVQHALIDALIRDLHGYDDDLEARAIKGWNKLCMVLLEMLSRAYGKEHEAEADEGLMAVDPQEMYAFSVESYEKSLGMRRNLQTKEVFVASSAEIPEGERKLISVDGLSIGVFHHKGGWYGLRNTCLHRGGPVCTGRMEGDNLVCPWHGYTYEVTTGELLIDRTAKLDCYKVILRDDQVYVEVPQVIEPVDMFAFGIAVESPAPAVQEQKAAPRELAENEFLVKDVEPGVIRLVHWNGRNIAVYNVDGQYFATQNECTHAGAPLNEGTLLGDEITCPWHYSCFNVRDGSVTCPPAEDPLRTYRVEVDGEIGRVVEG